MKIYNIQNDLKNDAFCKKNSMCVLGPSQHALKIFSESVHVVDSNTTTLIAVLWKKNSLGFGRNNWYF